MSFFNDLKKKYTELLNPVKKSLSDDSGWFRQGKFTPVKQVQSIANNFNPTSNAGNNFWSSPVATKLADVQRVTQPVVQQTGQNLWQGVLSLGKLNAYSTPGVATKQERQEFKNYNPKSDIISGTKGVLTAYGLANPALAAKSAVAGGVLNTGINAWQNYKQQQPLSQNSKQAFMQGAGTGLANAGTTRLTNSLVQGLAEKVPFLRKFTEQSLTSNLPTGNEPLKEAVSKWLNVAGNKLVKAAVIETAVETPIWATLTQTEQEKYIDAIRREAVQNLQMNIAFAGLDATLDTRTLAPIVKQSIDQSVNNYFKNATTPGAISKQGGYLDMFGNIQDGTARTRDFDNARDVLNSNDPKITQEQRIEAQNTIDQLGRQMFSARKYKELTTGKNAGTENLMRAVADKIESDVKTNMGYSDIPNLKLQRQMGAIKVGDNQPFPQQPRQPIKTGGEGVKGQSGLDTTTLQSPVKTTTELPTKILSTPNLKTDVSLPDSISRVKQEVTTNKGTAEVAKLTREPFSVATIADINKLKQVARSRAFLEGDIETLRKRGDLVNKVVEAIQKVRPDITNEADALDFALNFPTKSAMTVKRPVLSPQEKQIRFEKLKEETKWKKEFGEIVSEIEGQAEADKSLFKQTGATLTPRGYSNQQTKNIRIQSDASRRAELEANKYFKEISIPAYKQGSVNLGDRLPADELLKTSKDKVAFAYQRETIQRNIEDIFGKNSKMKSFVVDNITNNENKSTIFQNNLKTNLQKTFKDLGIKKGSRQDYAAADFIEGNLSLEQLKDYFPNNWQNIVKASNEGRTVYKNLLGQINQQLTRFGYDAIPERKNYVTHTTQLQTFADKIGNFLNLNSDELPRTMAGINMETKPGKKFFSFGLQRKGGSTHEGLITALEKYLPSASRQIYHTEDIQRGRAILDFLQRSADEGDTRLSGFTSYFSQYVDHLAGKQNIIDRPVEKILGRKFLEIGDWVRKRTGANMVGGNLSSAATNFIPFTQSAATTSKPAFARGLLESALNFGKNPSTVDGVQSGFLLRRFAKERITGTLGENIKDTASLPFKLVDKFTSTSIVAGKYFEQLKKGLSKEKAMAVADDYAQRVMADRSFGQSPLLFNSRVLGALTQFQLEVNNQMSFLAKDIPKNMGYSKSQIASSLVQFGIYAYIFNNLYEKVMGRRPQIDLIQAAISTQQGLAEGQGLQAFNPMNQEGKGFSDRTGTGQILNQLPFTSIGGGRLPIASAFTNPQYFLLPPLGGGQIKKTVEGLGAYNKGYSETDKGNVRYPIKKDTSNLIKTAAFGQYAVPEAQKYFSEGRKPLSDTASTTVKNSSNITTSYNLARGKSDMEAKVKVVKDRVKTTGQEETFNGKKYYVGSEFDSKTGESTPVVKSVKVSQSTSDVYQNLDKQYETSEDSPKNILQKVKVYGTGIFKDPKGTLEAIKSGQPIRKVRGDAVVVERLKNLSSLDQGDKATEVDHVIAVALGGSNNESNLQVISKQDNRAKGVVDTYLAKELEAGRITKKEAQERDLNWRQEINTLPASEKAKAQKILSENPIKITTTTTNTLESLASREYEPIKTDSGYSNIQLKLPEPPKLTGQTELDKQLKSKYSSALSTYKTNIGKLYLDGQLTAEEANKALTEISNKKISVSKAKKPKKVTFKKPKVIKLKAVKIKYAKIKMPKIKKVKAYKRPRIKKMAVKRVKLKLPKA
jgi:hypothetical protein